MSAPAPLTPISPGGPSSPASTTSPAPSIATWKRETSASSCASTPRPSWSRSATNDLIANLKKPPHLRGSMSWIYKERALDRLASELAAALDPAWLATATLVPIPPSRARTDPRHDDRMLRFLHRIEDHLRSGLPGTTLDIRELLLQRRTTSPVHATPGRPTPTTLAALYEIDETLTSPPPRALGIFDDVLTTGAHFKAAQRVLQHGFPGIPIAGIFLARTTRIHS